MREICECYRRLENPIFSIVNADKNENVSSDIFRSYALDFAKYKNVYLFERYKCRSDVRTPGRH